MVDRLIQVQQDRSQTREKKKNNDNKSNKNKLINKPKINPYFLPTVPKKKKIICNALRTFQLKVTVTLISGDKME